MGDWCEKMTYGALASRAAARHGDLDYVVRQSDTTTLRGDTW